MMPYQPSEALQQLVTQLIDETIGLEGMEELDSILASEEDARAWYLIEMRMHSALFRWAASMEPEPLGVHDAIKLEQKQGLWVASLSAAVVLLVTIVVMKFFMVKDPPPISTFRMTDRAQFTLTHASSVDIPEGAAQLKRGSRLQLSQGVVELTFSSGVKSIIMAPADITLNEEHEVFLREGAAWFSVPSNAIGFRVKTSDLEVVDLGTKFAVLGLKDDYDEVHVFKGKVEVKAQRLRKEESVLTAGQACRIDPIGRLQEIESRPLDFLETLPEKSPYPYFHWSFDNIVDDGFVASGDHPSIAEGFLRSMGRSASEIQTEGRFGSAVYLDGKGDWLESKWMGISGRQPRTVLAWFRFPEEMGSQFDVNGLSWGARLEDAQSHQNAKFVLSGCSRANDHRGHDIFPHLSFGETWCQGNTNLKDGSWHCIAVTYSGKTLVGGQPDVVIYVDGEEEELTWTNVNPLATVDTDISENRSRSFNFGKTLRNNKKDAFFQGLIDEVYLFEGVLSEYKIRHLSRSNIISCQE